MQKILKNINLTYTVKKHILDSIKDKLASKGKKKYAFSLNDILNAYYANELERYEEFNKLFFDAYIEWTTCKTDEDVLNIIVKSILYLNEIQKDIINFQKSYGDFINVLESYNLQEFGSCDSTFLRALFQDIRVVFNFHNSWEANEGYIMDDSIELFNNYFSNTLFRNYVVIFAEELLRQFPHQKIETFVLDIIANNRKIHTLLKPEQAAKSKAIKDKNNEVVEKKKYLYEIDFEAFQESIKEEWIKDFQDKINQEYPFPNHLTDIEKDTLKQELTQQAIQENKWKYPFFLTDMMLRSLKKKIFARWASIFSNQLKVFSMKRQKFLKEKEMTWDTTFVEHVNFLHNDQAQNQLSIDTSTPANLSSNSVILNIKKACSYDEMTNQIISIINLINNKEDKIINYSLLWVEEDIQSVFDEQLNTDQIITDNIYEVLLNCFGSNQQKYIEYFNEMIKKNPQEFKKIYFYVSTLIDSLIELDPTLYSNNKKLFTSIGVLQ